MEEVVDVESLRMDSLEVVQLDAVDSTNGYLRRVATASSKPLAVIANVQSAGQGQQGTHWDSLRGDATFSLRLAPRGLPAVRTFLLSQLLSLALQDVLARLGVTAAVKWPNDLLVQRKKVCGVLIETHLQGANVRHAILGVGVNLAPRPRGFLGYSTPATTLADWVGAERIPTPLTFVQMLAESWNACLGDVHGCVADAIRQRYVASLFNSRGLHSFEDSDGSFRAEVVGTTPAGEFILRREDGTQRTYSFKEVRQKVS